MKTYVTRSLYLNRMIGFKDSDVIKVITGIRRSGKSVLLQQYKEYLIHKAHIPDDRIILLNLESMQNAEAASSAEALYAFVMGRIGDSQKKEGRYYILLDEIQNIPGWEKVLSSLQTDISCDLYITGSNAQMLSSDLATKIAGRYVEIHILPFSYGEFLLAHKKENSQVLFSSYLAYGGFPGLADFYDGNLPSAIKEVQAHLYLEGLYNTVVVKDILERNRIRDTYLLQRILTFVVANIGNMISATAISKSVSGTVNEVPSSTVVRYLEAMEQAFVIYRMERVDIGSRKRLSSPTKYYVVDSGLRNIGVETVLTDTGRQLENTVFLELIRRGYSVSTGTGTGNIEVDFIAVRGREKQYFQVSLSVVDPHVLEREVRSLKAVDDNYPKTILTMDQRQDDSIDGIKIHNVQQWLLEEAGTSDTD